jgi:hypothetical protein
MKRIFAAALLFCLALLWLPASLAAEECTTVVVARRATVDGRPLLWKNRDADDIDNEAVYIAGGTYPFVAIISANSTTSTWMGINSAGLAIENSLSSDLEGTSSGQNGSFMKYALQYCATVAEFEQLLFDTNVAGRLTKANYGVIDATGAAAIFETGNHTFAKYDADDPSTAPLGYVVRTNFAFTGDGSGTGYERYFRAIELVEEGINAGVMNHEFLLRNVARDLRNDLIDPYPLPYEGTQEGHSAGYVRTYYSINRYRTRACAVFHGVRPDENPLLSTMWVILGEPVCGTAVPLWVHAGTVPPEMNGTATAPWSDAILEKKADCYTDTSFLPYASQYLDTYALADGLGGGILMFSLPIEDRAFSQTQTVLEAWRDSFPSSNTIADFERDIIYESYCLYRTSTAPTDIPAPADLAVRRVLNRSLSQAEFIDVLTWNSVHISGGISGYRIYELVNGEKIYLGQVDSSTTRFWHRGLRSSDRFFYVVAAVDTRNREGNPACVAIGGIDQPNPVSQRERAAYIQSISVFLKMSARLAHRF